MNTTIKKMIDWVSGRYVKTVSNQTIFGEGNIAGGGSGSAEWGNITGTLSNQTDLNSELGNKLDKLTDAGEFVYTHEGSIQNSKGFIAGDTLLNSSAHIPSAHTTYKAIQDLINDTVKDLTHTWSSEKINSLITATLDCKVVATMPTNPIDNTLYLVGPMGTAPNIYYEKKLRVDGVTYDAGTTNVDLSAYYNKTEVDNLLDDKQDTLVSGTNIKTINNESLLGNGNINVAGSSLESGISDNTTNVGSGANSWQILVTVPAGVTPTGYLCSTEGTVGSVYISSVTKMSNTQYRLNGWANVGSGAQVKAQISWIKLV